MTRAWRFTVLSLLLCLPLTAVAESPRNVMVELKFGPFRPEVDREFRGKTPWADAFGQSQFLMTQLELDWEFFTKVGVLALGGTIGYSRAQGHSRTPDGEKAEDSTSFHLLPLSLSLIYRFDWAAHRYSVPLVPVVKGGMDGWFWWATNGVGQVSRSQDEVAGRGLTFGGHVSVGLMFLLDVLAQGMAKTFDNELGVNNSYLFAEYRWSWIDDFGSSKSIRLSYRNFLAGIAFEF